MTWPKRVKPENSGGTATGAPAASSTVSVSPSTAMVIVSGAVSASRM